MEIKLDEWRAKGSYFRFKELNIFFLKEGNGPVLLVFHGYPYNGFDFNRVLNDLATRFTVIIPDMPGMGFSDKPDRHTYSFNEMADMYASVLDNFKVTEVHVLSHDLGNSVVQELIARDGESGNLFTIKSVVFLNGGLFTDVYQPRLIQILLSQTPKPIGRLLSKLMTKSMVSKATAEVFGEKTKPTPERLDDFWKVLNFNKGKSIAYLLGRLIFEKKTQQKRWIDAMCRTSIPMCFVNGPADPNSGVHMANRYRELIPDANVVLLNDDIGHWPQIEAPNQVLEAFHFFHRQFD